MGHRYEHGEPSDWTYLEIDDKGDKVEIYERVDEEAFESFGWEVPLNERGDDTLHTHTEIEWEEYKLLYDRDFDGNEYRPYK